MSDTTEQPFLWALGIEDTNIGWPLAASSAGLDEYELTAHYAQWREDLQAAAAMGAGALRYGFPWYKVEPSREAFDWTFTDAVVGEARRLGIDLIVDLVHYGTPQWLSGSFLDPEYPERVARYAEAIASRYRNEIRYLTPLNEPLVTASFVGERGIWPPYKTGEDGWARVVVALADGMQRTIRAVRAVAPEMKIVHVEACQIWSAPSSSDDDRLYQDLRVLRQRSWLPTDLMLGRVDEAHELHEWLVTRGVAADVLGRLRAGGVAPDYVGVNYYPELSARELVRDGERLVQVVYNAWTDGLEQVVTDFWKRYGLPVLVSETAVEGSDSHRAEWLQAAWTTLHGLRDEGTPVAGMVWWPMFDFVDWAWATGDQVIEEFHVRQDGRIAPVVPPRSGSNIDSFFRRMGLMRLDSVAGRIERVPTAVSDLFLRLALQREPSDERK